MHTVAPRILTVVLVLSSPVLAAQESPKNHASWWVHTYGLVDISTSPYAARAEKVFTRVAATADKKANRLPRLVIIKAQGDPFAVALPDGTVVLTEGGLEICYRGVKTEDGDARAAFVMGHELAHLSNDDFWHAAAFDAFRSREPGNVLAELLRRGEKEAQSAELHADAYGLLYLTMAGYDPTVLLGQKESFFEEWVSQASGARAYADGTHRPPSERAELLVAQLAAVANELDFFHFGVRLYQLGRFDDALLLLGRFKERFPSREVFNNIGLCHYQLAVRFLGECNGQEVVRFKLPTVIDPETRARRIRSGSGSSGCLQAETFQNSIRAAILNLEQAMNMDPWYLPARLNMLSSLNVSGQGARALSVAEDAKELAPNDVQLLNARAVALYLYGLQSGIETTDNAVGILRDLLESHPGSPDVAYNLATILSERGRIAAAEEAWRDYFALEQEGIFAVAARDWLKVGEAPAKPRGLTAAPKFESESPIPLGPITHETRRQLLVDTTRTPFVIGDFRGAVYKGDQLKALSIGSSVEIVEKPLGNRLTDLQAREQYGTPAISYPTAMGDLLFYGDHMLEVVNGVVRNSVHFKSTRRSN